VVLLIAYLFAPLAHYRLIVGRSRWGSRTNPEPAEERIMWATIVLAGVAGLLSACQGCMAFAP